MDDCERAQIAQLRDNEIAIQEQLRFKITEISTGYCDICGELIHPERVRILNATTCIACARIEEQRMKKWGL